MTESNPDTPDRRPLRTRQMLWARSLAAALARAGISPNSISMASLVFAGIGCALGVVHGYMLYTPASRATALVLFALCIQARLLCNMLDGMVAVEGNRRSSLGDLYNELPDRAADTALLVGAGYAAAASPWAVELGWSAAVLAMLTAYIRALGRSLDTAAYFQGPMAKPHRMALLTLACLVAAGFTLAPSCSDYAPAIITYGLLLIIFGAAITAARRTLLIARELQARGPMG